MKIEIYCTQDIGLAITKLLSAMETVAGESFSDERLWMEVDPLKMKAPPKKDGRKSGARVHYQAILPTGSEDDIMAQVRANVETLGSHTIKGLVYQDIVAATREAKQITEPEIRERRYAGKAGTSQREVGDLVRMGLVTSVPIVRTVEQD